MKVLVTGGTGFIGRSLCQEIGTIGHETVATVRGTPHAGQVIVGDINAATDWRQALRGCTGVVHLAGRVHVMRDETTDPLAEFCKVNVDGTLNLARQAAKAGVRRFVFLSSIKVNGEETSLRLKNCPPPARGNDGGEPTRLGGATLPLNPPSQKKGGYFCETDVPAPQDAYALSKWEAEQGLMAIALETSMEVVIIRPPLVYGPGAKGNFASLVKWARNGVPLPFGAVRNKRSLIALDNLVSFIALCVDRERSPSAANQVFVISDGEDVSTAELLRKIARAYGKRACLIPVPAAWLRLAARILGMSAVTDRLLGSLVVDSSKARDLLGWQPVVSMDEQLRKMARDAACS